MVCYLIRVKVIPAVWGRVLVCSLRETGQGRGYYCFVPSFDGSRCWGFPFEGIVEDWFRAWRAMKLFRVF